MSQVGEKEEIRNKAQPFSISFSQFNHNIRTIHKRTKHVMLVDDT